MSGGAVFRRALCLVLEKDLPLEAERDLVAALEAARSGPLDFCYRAGVDAGLERDALLLRSAAILFNFASANLADDLADGDCDYLDSRAAPGVQYVLHCLFFETLARTGSTPEQLASLSAQLAAAAAPHSIEVRTTAWSLATAKQIALGLAGEQYSVYLQILWAGTRLEPRAAQIGRALGLSAHVAIDLATGDRRASSLPAGERRALAEWALRAAERLERERLPCIAAVLGGVVPKLREAIESPRPFEPAQVVAYYAARTPSILRKFGPGPRVHYHTGLWSGPVSPDWTTDGLRRHLVAAQERLLEHVAERWQASAALRGAVLDAGCGLGGGAIFWAQRFGARVTAVTNVPEHLDLLRAFAAQAGVAERIEPLLCDAERVPGAARFDAAVAIEASCYFARQAWFERLSHLLRPQGRIFVVDCFLGRPEAAGFFDGHWRTRIGTLEEYEAAAASAGFRMESIEELNELSSGFWELTLAWTRKVAQERGALEPDPALERSLRAHELLHRAYLDRGVRHLQLVFGRR